MPCEADTRSNRGGRDYSLPSRQPTPPDYAPRYRLSTFAARTAAPAGRRLRPWAHGRPHQPAIRRTVDTRLRAGYTGDSSLALPLLPASRSDRGLQVREAAEAWGRQASRQVTALRVRQEASLHDGERV